VSRIFKILRIFEDICGIFGLFFGVVGKIAEFGHPCSTGNIGMLTDF
jgi:hypothetical protein